MSPPAMKTSRHNRMIGRRVSPNDSRPFNTAISLSDPNALRRRLAAISARGCRQGIAEEQRPFGGDQLAHLQAFEVLPVAVALHAALDQPLFEPPPLGPH